MRNILIYKSNKRLLISLTDKREISNIVQFGRIIYLGASALLLDQQ